MRALLLQHACWHRGSLRPQAHSESPLIMHWTMRRCLSTSLCNVYAQRSTARWSQLGGPLTHSIPSSKTFPSNLLPSQPRRAVAHHSSYKLQVPLKKLTRDGYAVYYDITEPFLSPVQYIKSQQPDHNTLLILKSRLDIPDMTKDMTLIRL